MCNTCNNFNSRPNFINNSWIGVNNNQNIGNIYSRKWSRCKGRSKSKVNNFLNSSFPPGTSLIPTPPTNLIPTPPTNLIPFDPRFANCRVTCCKIDKHVHLFECDDCQRKKHHRRHH